MSVPKLPRFQLSWPAVSRLVIIGVWLVIVLANFTPGTRNLSWDLMDSSFDPSLNIWRSLVGTWQSFQGLGVLGGHGYAAQLPHALLMWVLDLFLPQSMLRYVFAFGMLLLGGLGSFELIRHVLRQVPTRLTTKQHSLRVSLAALIGSVVYLLHYGTVQTFYVHLEPFITMYGLLPWALWGLFHLFEKQTAGRWLAFFALNFFLSIIGFIPPIFISYVLFVSLALVSYVLGRFSRRRLWVASKVVAIIIATNLYWLSTVAAFTVMQPDYYLQSKLNQLSTQEFIIKNQTYGEFPNVALLNSFYLDSNDQARFDDSKTLEPILTPWLERFEQPSVQIIGWIIFVLAVMGWLIALWFSIKTRKPEFSVGLMGILTFSLLATGVPVVNWLPKLMALLPPLEQAFRIPFTKLSMSMTLFLALGVSLVLYWILALLVTHSKSRIVNTITTVLAAVCLMSTLIWYSAPSFAGHFLYKGSLIKMPPAYQAAMEFFNQPEHRSERILPLPIATNTGWDMLDWGYTGSGFWWYGINNPIAHRSFDVWSPYNETLYNQISTALYANDAETLVALLDVYDISYVLLDESVIWPGKDSHLLLHEQTQQLMTSLGGKEVFNASPLTIWDVSAVQTNQGAVYIPDQATTIEANTLFTRWNPVLKHPQGISYLSSGDAQLDPNVIFPFAHLTTEKLGGVSVHDNVVLIKKELDPPQPPGSITIPSLQLGQTYTTTAQLSLNNQQLVIEFPHYQITLNDSDKHTVPTLPNVEIPLSESGDYLVEINEYQVTVSSNNSLSIPLSTTIGEPITINYFPQDKVQTIDGQRTIASDDVETAQLDAAVWSPLLTPQQIFFEDEMHIIVLEINAEHIGIDLTQDEVVNCQADHLGEVRRTIDTAGAIHYRAIDRASACQGVALLNTSNHQGYILHLSGENEASRSLKFYLTNWANERADVEYLLDNGTFDQMFSVLPWSNLDEDNYSFNVETRSFGKESKNSLSKAQLFPVDLLQIATITIQSDKVQTQPFETATNHTLSRISSFGTGMLTVSVNSATEESMLIVLSQAYDPAWLAFARPTNTSWWQLTSYQRLPHHRYNGWANAWQVPGCEGQENQNCAHQIIIFYWPQLLSWAGYVLLLTSGGWLVYQVWRSPSSGLPPNHTPPSLAKRHRLAQATKDRLAP